MTHSKECWYCQWLYKKRPACHEWLIGYVGNYVLPLLAAAVFYWALWRFGP